MERHTYDSESGRCRIYDGQFRQGFASMSTPTKEFYRVLMEGQNVHAGYLLLRWMAGNVVIETDAAENIKVIKAESKEKIVNLVTHLTNYQLMIILSIDSRNAWRWL